MIVNRYVKVTRSSEELFCVYIRHLSHYTVNDLIVHTLSKIIWYIGVMLLSTNDLVPLT